MSIEFSGLQLSFAIGRKQEERWKEGSCLGFFVGKSFHSGETTFRFLEWRLEVELSNA
jgi:hypothetical protein